MDFDVERRSEDEWLTLPERFAELIRRNGSPVSLAKHQMLCREGDCPDGCCYILTGRIVAYECTRSGSEHFFNESGPGELLFVPALIVAHPLILNFRAIEPTQLIRIPRDALFRLMDETPELSTALLCALSMRFISTVERYRQRGSCDAAWRVSKLLLSMAERDGVACEGQVLIPERISQQTMANHLHANRVTVARAIRDLKDAGLIEYHGGHYYICGTERLRRHMYELRAMEDED